MNIKKLLFVTFVLITFASCTHQTVEKKDLPIEVVELKELNGFDTTYTITTDIRVFVFDAKKEYLGTYRVENSDFNLFWLGLLIGLLILLMVVIVIASI